MIITDMPYYSTGHVTESKKFKYLLSQINLKLAKHNNFKVNCAITAIAGLKKEIVNIKALAPNSDKKQNRSKQDSNA